MSSKAENTENETDQFDFEAFGDEEISEDLIEEASATDPFNFGEHNETTPKTSRVQPPSPPPSKTKKASVPSATPSRAAKIGGASLVQEAQVQVTAVLGKKALTVGELVDLKKGEVLELNRFPNEAIDLVANGKLMAKGELVEVDGKLGVQIIKIF